MGSQENIQSSISNLRMLNDLQNAYMEVIPVPKIEQKLETISRDTHLAITCSPTKGVDETIELSEILVDMGFNVTPHVAAKCVTNESHLVSIVDKLHEKGIESIFVPGGDRPKPAGDFKSAYELLNCLNSIDHKIKNIGIAAHPEGHPDIEDEVLIKELKKKKPLATYIVTQMCFDARLLGDWLCDIKDRGIDLPVWVGLPGVIERGRLLRTSLRIGVGDSLRFLRKKTQVASELMKSSTYYPDRLVTDISEYEKINQTNLAGYHIYCFNQIEISENWRNEKITSLR